MNTSGCEICGSGSMALIYNFNDRDIFRCAQCGTGRTFFKNDRSASQQRFDEPRWIETRKMVSRILMKEAEIRYRLLRRFCPGKRILEIGCGTGEFLTTASSFGHEAVGLDLSGAVVEYLRAKSPQIAVFSGDLENANLQDESFDVVAAFHVLEHIDKVTDFLSSLHKKIRPDGILFASVPNIDCLYHLVMRKKWWGLIPEHVWHFSREGFSTIIEQAGFDILEMRTTGYERYSMWPVLPLLYGNFLRRLGSTLSPGQGPEEASQAKRIDKRLIMKKSLLWTYNVYRRMASLMLSPALVLQNELGYGVELTIVAKKSESRIKKINEPTCS